MRYIRDFSIEEYEKFKKSNGDIQEINSIVDLLKLAFLNFDEFKKYSLNRISQ